MTTQTVEMRITEELARLGVASLALTRPRSLAEIHSAIRLPSGELLGGLTRLEHPAEIGTWLTDYLGRLPTPPLRFTAKPPRTLSARRRRVVLGIRALVDEGITRPGTRAVWHDALDRVATALRLIAISSSAASRQPL